MVIEIIYKPTSFPDQKMINAKLTQRFDPWLVKPLVLLSKNGINPNVLTLMGLLFSFLAALGIICDKIILAGVITLIAGGFDILDGAAARIFKKVTPFGKFLDSVVDRYSDTFIYLGLMVYFSLHRGTSNLILTGIVLLGCILIPYTRAKAETLIGKCNIGLMERPERVILLSFGLIFNMIIPVLWTLAILCHFTVFQRIFYTRKRLEPDGIISERDSQ
jgi:CDP-diacylglycerol---glycerol-3-phosphate 3-phosphatidyltransferase